MSFTGKFRSPDTHFVQQAPTPMPWARDPAGSDAILRQDVLQASSGSHAGGGQSHGQDAPSGTGPSRDVAADMADIDFPSRLRPPDQGLGFPVKNEADEAA